MNETNAATHTKRDREFIPGYRPVLVQEDVKDALLRFREQHGFGRESHIERCLATAGLKLLLSDAGLHQRWLELLAEVVGDDFRLIASRGGAR